MDFFAHQDRARRNTKVLVFYFAMAVACITVSVYFACLLLFYGWLAQQGSTVGQGGISWWQPWLLLYVAAGTLGVVFLGSLYKTVTLLRGGGAIARALGGRLLVPGTLDPDERKLQNVVEEMVIASGTPVPEVYVLDHEKGINAFAAGRSLDDAAIGVTRGCMTQLSRDELQGVIAHEFSHILNGDMRLNLRVMGVVFGILCLTVIGRVLLHTRGGRDRNPLIFLGLALVVIGWVGVFFGRLIQAALSRQREFLADAAAIQFTRNPTGLSGALKKIGGAGSRIHSAHAEEASHMFFGNGMGTPFMNSFATHPPLEERIRRIDPGWDGKFKFPDSPAPRVAKVRDARKASAPREAPARRGPVPAIPAIPGFPGAADGAAGVAGAAVAMGALLPGVGKPTGAHLRLAEEMLGSFSERLKDAAHAPQGAAAIVFAMLLSGEDALRERQRAELALKAAPRVAEELDALWREVAGVPRPARLSLLNLALPALRQLPADEFQRFSETLHWLIESDNRVDLFEFVLQKIVRRHLAARAGKKQARGGQFYALKPLLPDCGVLLSALAHAGSRESGEVEAAFAAGAFRLGAGKGPQLLPRGEIGLQSIDAALDRLALASPAIKKKFIEACVQAAGADGVIQVREAELLRAIGETLECPMPPILAPGGGA
ncbi:MAG: M48 family metalloprotease [Candidatus Hydrogenedentes bacterium]|nr:M48 family metalloprotease [Candidatus Hydrogenedentota bacterium]